MGRTFTASPEVPTSYFNRFGEVLDKYLPDKGQGDSLATQIATAVNKLVYRFYNDGDVFDTTGYLYWAAGEKIESYANWLYNYVDYSKTILDKVFECRDRAQYSHLLQELADTLLDSEFLYQFEDAPSAGSIYSCNGPYKVEDVSADEDEEDDY